MGLLAIFVERAIYRAQATEKTELQNFKSVTEHCQRDITTLSKSESNFKSVSKSKPDGPGDSKDLSGSDSTDRIALDPHLKFLVQRQIRWL